jgi:hypothetical protein
MKKLLIAIPLSFCLAVSAQTNEKELKKENKTQEEVKSKDDVKAKTSLDGKSFKITFANRVLETPDSPAATDRKKEKSGSGNVSEVKPVSPVEQPEPVKTMDEKAAMNQEMPADHTKAVPETPVTPETPKPVTPPSDKDAAVESFDHTKMVLTFDNGMIRSTALATKGIQDCPYHVNSASGNIVSFSSNCKSNVTKVRGMWSGIVEGNTIRGNFTWTTDDGRNLSYTFKGSAASQKEIDASRELGVR